MLQLEEYGCCKKGEGGQYVSGGTITLGGKRPNNASGGRLCEGYTHGINTVMSYVELHPPIMPAFLERVPYHVLLVELDTQQGQPTEHEVLRIVGNLTDAKGELISDKAQLAWVGIGTRVRMIFADVGTASRCRNGRSTARRASPSPGDTARAGSDEPRPVQRRKADREGGHRLGACQHGQLPGAPLRRAARRAAAHPRGGEVQMFRLRELARTLYPELFAS